MTDNASTTNNTPTMANTNSCFVATAIAPRAPPKANDQVSPINTAAGGALYHKKPKPAPTKAEVKTNNSPVPCT